MCLWEIEEGKRKEGNHKEREKAVRHCPLLQDEGQIWAQAHPYYHFHFCPFRPALKIGWPHPQTAGGRRRRFARSRGHRDEHQETSHFCSSERLFSRGSLLTAEKIIP